MLKHWIKRWAVLAATIMILISTTSDRAYAESSGQLLVMKVNHPIVYLNDMQMRIEPHSGPAYMGMEPREVVPIVRNGTTLIPVRFVAEAFGLAVAYEAQTRTVHLVKDDFEVRFVLDEKEMTVNEEIMALIEPAISINGRSLIPLRALAEAMGKHVYYEDGIIVISDDEVSFKDVFAKYEQYYEPYRAIYFTELGKYGFVNAKGELVLEPIYKQVYRRLEVFDTATRPVAIESEGETLWGIVNKAGEFVIEPQYSSASPFDRGKALMSWGGLGYAEFYLNEQGEAVGRYHNVVYPYSDGLAIVGDYDFSDETRTTPLVKFGFMDELGANVIEQKFDYVSNFSQGLSVVNQGAVQNSILGKPSGGKYGYIDRAGEIVIPLQFADAFSFVNGLATVKDFESGKWGVINSSGLYVISPQFDRVIDPVFIDGLMRVVVDSKFGVINKLGNFIVPPQYYDINPFDHGFARGVYELQINVYAKHHYIDSEGKVTDFKTIGKFSEGLASAEHNNGTKGYINTLGHFAIKANYDYLGQFSEGLALFRDNNTSPATYGYMNKKGEVAIAPQPFTRAFEFIEGLALVYVMENGIEYEALLNQEGKIVFIAK